MPHSTQIRVKGKKGAAAWLAGDRAASALRDRKPRERRRGAAVSAAGRGRQTPRRRRGMLRTAAGTGAGPQPAESGRHSVPHGPGLPPAHPAELRAVISGCSPKIVSDPATSLTWH